MTSAPLIVWFRRDLRLADNPALSEAVKTGQPLICLYIYEKNCIRPLGAASKLWLHHSLLDLSKKISEIGASLVLRRGDAHQVLNELIKSSGVNSVYWNRRYAEDARKRDEIIKSDLVGRRLSVKTYRANLLSEPWKVKTCLLYTSPSPRDGLLSRMPSSA